MVGNHAGFFLDALSRFALTEKQSEPEIGVLGWNRTNLEASYSLPQVIAFSTLEQVDVRQATISRLQ